MPRKVDLMLVACFAACLLCLPVLLTGGVVVMFCFAVFGEIAARLSGDEPPLPNAREMAQRLCGGINS